MWLLYLPRSTRTRNGYQLELGSAGGALLLRREAALGRAWRAPQPASPVSQAAWGTAELAGPGPRVAGRSAAPRSLGAGAGARRRPPPAVPHPELRDRLPPFRFRFQPERAGGGGK